MDYESSEDDEEEEFESSSARNQLYDYPNV
jgi:hypothetical protein